MNTKFFATKSSMRTRLTNLEHWPFPAGHPSMDWSNSIWRSSIQRLILAPIVLNPRCTAREAGDAHLLLIFVYFRLCYTGFYFHPPRLKRISLYYPKPYAKAVRTSVPMFSLTCTPYASVAFLSFPLSHIIHSLPPKATLEATLHTLIPENFFDVTSCYNA